MDFPLRARIESLSKTGNLTITFNKPIILPPIQLQPIEVDNESRILDSGENLISLKEVVNLWVDSEFYDNTDE